MKQFTTIILAILLFVGLTYAGKSIFGMDHGMTMGSIECVNHCIDSSVFPVVPSSALPLLLFVVCSIAVVMFREGGACPTPTIMSRRMTEPIRLFLLSKTLSSVIIRD